MALSLKELKISNICLTMHKHKHEHKSLLTRQYYVHVSISGKDIDATTAKKPLTGDRVRWDESSSLPVLVDANDVDDSIVVFDIFKTRQFHPNSKVASFREKAKVLIQSRDQSGSCKLEDKTCDLTFSIVDETNALRALMEGTSNAVTKLPGLETLAEFANIVTSAVPVLAKQEDTWTSFLKQFKVFMSTMDDIAELHPYAKIAWSILSLIPKTIISQHNRNDSVRKLSERLNDVCGYMTDAKQLPKFQTDTPTKALSDLLRQTIECARFIKHYCANNSVLSVLQGITIDDKCKEFVEKLDRTKEVLTTSIILNTSIESQRASEGTRNIEDWNLINDMPYDSNAGFVSAKLCLPGTREKILKEIQEWVDNDTSQRILLLSGQAGTGKSAIAHTIAEIFRKKNKLVSLFCFDRSHKDRRNFLFSTISRNLADNDLWRRDLLKAIKDTSIRKSTDLHIQFEEFVIKPSKEVMTAGPFVIIIDALDESGDREERRPILNLLFKRCSELPTNYRIIITSRAEYDIELLACNNPVTILHKRMGDIKPDETLFDIQSYISNRLKSIASVLDNINKDWPRVLAKHSEGHFQWAAAACLFIDQVAAYPPIETRWNTCVLHSSSKLYDLYQHIISSQPEYVMAGFLQNFKTVMGAIMVAREPFSINALQNIFPNVRDPDVQTTLDPFGSLFSGVNDVDKSTVVRPLHTSLFDYFNQPDSRFYIDTSDRGSLALGCLKLMNRMLRFNICQLETSHIFNDRIPDFSSRVEKFIPIHLAQACRTWSFYLSEKSKFADGLVAEIRFLMHKNLLFFIETLGLLGEIERGRVAMKAIQTWCKDVDSELAGKAANTWQFISDFEPPIKKSTPHLYISALPFAPSDSFVSKQYLSLYPQLLSIEVDEVTRSTSFSDCAIKKTPSFFHTSVFSPRGNYIATGPHEGELWILDSRTGYIVHKLDLSRDSGATLWDRCQVVFSPDKEVVYCCLENGIIWVWDLKTGDPVLESYPNVLGKRGYMCTISSDGCYIAFQSYTGEIRIHDREARQEVKQFDAIYNYDDEYLWDCRADNRGMFCPNGNFFVFVESSPNAIGLWNTRNQLLETYPLDPNSNCLLQSFGDNHIVFSLGLDCEDLVILDVHKMTRRDWKMKHYIISATLFPDDERLLSVIRDHNAMTAPGLTYFTIWNINTKAKVWEACMAETLFISAVSHDSRFMIFHNLQGTIHVRQVDRPLLSSTETPDSELFSPLDLAWLRKRLITTHHTTSRKCYFWIFDIGMNKTLFESEDLELFPVVVPDKDQHASVAFVTNGGRSLGLWSEAYGRFVTEGYANDRITTLSFSAAGDHLIFADTDGIVGMLDIRSHPPICENICVVTHTVVSLAISTTATRFLVACQVDNELTVEVRECRSGSLTATFFDGLRGLDTVAFSADDTVILYGLYEDITTHKNLAIWNITTGEKTRFMDLHSFQLSPDHRLIAFQRKGSSEITVWDIENEAAQKYPLSESDFFNPFEPTFKFSANSMCMVVVEAATGYLCRVSTWDLHTRKYTTDLLFSYGYSYESWKHEVDLYGSYFLLTARTPLGKEELKLHAIANWHILDIMRALYEHHQNNSQFGMYPVDHSDLGTTQLIEAYKKSPSEDVEVLNYALSAWHKALFSASSKKSDFLENSWIFGPHDEHLFWVPVDKRLWYPCMTYMMPGTFTKLNFDKFVHGSRWTECRANR